MEQFTNLEDKYRDITSEFMDMKLIDFRIFIRSIDKSITLKIEVDFTGIDKNQFIIKARSLKAILETYKDRTFKASIKCTREQMSWERNVFGSGVEWIENR